MFAMLIVNSLSHYAHYVHYDTVCILDSEFQRLLFVIIVNIILSGNRLIQSILGSIRHRTNKQYEHTFVK